jgi:TPR repeat protein
MRRQAFIARLGAAATVLLKVVPVGAAAALTFVLVLPAFPQDQQDATLACDRAAASPSDNKRPLGVPAVFFGSINPQIAIPACQQATTAEPENPRILFQLGRAYAAAKANESARACFQKSSDLGYPQAQANLGAFYAIGRGGLARNDTEALRLSRLAADQGDGLGHYILGFFYEVGRGGLPTDDNAPRQYKFAAEAGDNAVARNNLKEATHSGLGGWIRPLAPNQQDRVAGSPTLLG